jgi:hypothetical protein
VGDLDTHNVERLQVLSGLAYLELRSSQPQLLDPFFYHQLSLQNLWSSAPIVRKIDGEEYDLALIDGSDGPTDLEFLVGGFRGTSTFGDDTLGELKTHYRVLCEVPSFLAMVPRDRLNALQDKDIARIFRQPCRSTGRIPQLAPGLR